MNVTPKTMARQIVAARAEAARKPVFTSQTGVVRVVRRGAPKVEEFFEDYCFICSRCTDHAGEHYDVAEYVTQHISERFDEDTNTLYRHISTYVDRAMGPGMPWEECEKRMSA